MDLQAEEDVELIIKALEDKHDDVRWKAAKKLGEMGDKGAAEPLIKALEDEDVFFVKGRIALALGRIGDKRAVESLIRTLKHEDEDVRGKAALALGRIGDKRAVEPLIKALKDKHEYVRWRAAWALGRIGDKRAVEALNALKDERENVRKKAVWTPGKMSYEKNDKYKTQNRVKEVLERFTKHWRFRDAIEHVETIPGREAEYSDVDDLPENIMEYLEGKGIRPYRHQKETLEAARRGENVLITTPTASGKTLAFNLPILEALTNDPEATALYIYPAKALSRDQLKVLKELESELGLTLNPTAYEGDTPRDRRPWIRRNSRMVITNPHQLHRILPWHHQWRRFYSNLKYVVVDEAHQYRGVFGSNVAFLIRRLRRICRYYGSSPVFILVSATLANPEEFARKLTGLDFHVVAGDSSPSGPKHFVFYNPYLKRGEPSAHLETSNILTFLVRRNIQTLCFTVSRKMAELITRLTRQQLDSADRRLVERVTSYRAGYRPEERRKIEGDFKKGDLTGVTATNALEMGIDIGSLDAVIISGFPGTLISTWQQAGRAGRNMNDSMVVIVAFENPLDQYLMKNPSFLFERPHENAIIDLENRFILRNQTACAASELPLTLRDFSDYDFSVRVAGDMMEEGELEVSYDGLGCSGDPHFRHGLNDASSDTFTVIADGRVLETLSRSQAYREAHEGAVLLNHGNSYIVEDFDLEGRRITVRRKDVDYHTAVLKETELRVIGVLRRRMLNDLQLNFGEVEVTEHYTGYRLISYSRVMGRRELDLPPLRFRTRALWFTVPSSLRSEVEALFNEDDAFEGGLHGAEHAIIALFPLHVLCDRMDIGGLSTPEHPDTGAPTIFIYDGFEGGIGLSEKAMSVFEDLLASTLGHVSGCGCRDGCPSCIYSPKCGNDNSPLHKGATVRILEHLRSLAGGPVEDAEAEHGEDPFQEVARLYTEGMFSDAKLRLHEILEEKPGDPGACYLMGAILREQGEAEMAEYFHERIRRAT